MIIKASFIGVNLVCFIVGATILGIGIWSNVSSTPLTDLVINNEDFGKIELDKDVERTIRELMNATILKDASYALIILGSIIGGISFFGCVGAWKESSLFLFLYTISMLAMILAQIVLFLFVSEGSFLRDQAKNVMKDSMNPYKAQDENSSLFKLWDLASTGLECCGVDGYEDFYNQGMACYTLPRSCYKMKDACFQNSTYVKSNNIIPTFKPIPTTNSTNNFTTDSYQNKTYPTTESISITFYFESNDRFCDCENGVNYSSMNLGCFETLNIYLKEKYHGLIIGIFSGVVIFELLLIGFAGTIKTHRYILN